MTACAQASLASLRKAAAGAEAVLLATDPDREGEAIAWHLAHALRLPKSRYRRITFHEISRKAVQAALAAPRDLDPDLIDAQQARRVLDRLVGYQLSPLLWRKVQKGTSAGRVQSVAVKLIVDRERAIQAFVPEEYWTIDVRLSTDKEETFLARLIEVDGKKAEIGDASRAELVKGQLEESAYRIRDVSEKTVSRNPFPPFTTSTLQQAAGNRLRLPAKKTMSLAQSLYEDGLITYMRTDSVAISSDAISDIRRIILAQFGPDYVPTAPRRYATRAKNAQEAHEAIRPVHPDRTPSSLRTTLPPAEWRLYDLIWKRTLASQMPPAQYRQQTALVDGLWVAGPGRSPGVRERSSQESARGPGERSVPRGRGQRPQTSFLLRATASHLTFPGWLKAYGEEATPQPDADTDAPNDSLPDLSAGQVVYSEDVLPTQHFTQPPRRFTEPTLVKALEDAGIGRPSTYATVVSTIQDRAYVALEQRHFVPTELGFAANDFLVAHFPKIVDLPFTAEMESSLDEIAGGRLPWTQMLQSFYAPFHQTVVAASGAPMTRPKRAPAKVADNAPPCPQCGKPLVERTSQYGPFLGCSGYPTCKYIHRDPTAASSQPKKPFRRRRAAGPPNPRTKHVVRGRSSAKTSSSRPTTRRTARSATRRETD